MAKLIDNIAKVGHDNRFGALFDALRQKYTEAGKPLKGTFELTSLCTLDCKMCYVHCSDSSKVVNIPTEQWIDIIDQEIDAGMMYAVLTGGECFLHPGFRDIYTHLRKKGVIVQLLSNGTLIDESTIEWLKQMPPQLIRITVYGSCPEVYRQVTGDANAFFAVDRALDLLWKAGITTDISLTISKYNADDLSNLLEYVKGKPHAATNLECNLFEPESSTGRSLDDFALTQEEQEQLWETLFARQGYTFRPTCEEDFDLGAPEKEENRSDLMPCIAGIAAFSVSAQGIMRPCAQFPLANADVRELGFDRSWQLVHNAALEYRRSDECMKCDYFGKCKFCAARYALASGGSNSILGFVPCNKKLLVLPKVIQAKYFKGD